MDGFNDPTDSLPFFFKLLNNIDTTSGLVFIYLVIAVHLILLYALVVIPLTLMIFYCPGFPARLQEPASVWIGEVNDNLFWGSVGLTTGSTIGILLDWWLDFELQAQRFHWLLHVVGHSLDGLVVRLSDNYFFRRMGRLEIEV